MRRQPVLAHRHTVDQSGGHHPPANGALQAAEEKDADELWPQAALDAAAHPEEQQRQGENQADAARQTTVRPLPPEDRLERLDAHAPIELGVLRDLLVALEF